MPLRLPAWLLLISTLRPSPRPTLFPYTTLFRSIPASALTGRLGPEIGLAAAAVAAIVLDRKSTRLNSSHRCISYAVFCLKKNMIERREAGRLESLKRLAFMHEGVEQPCLDLEVV